MRAGWLSMSSRHSRLNSSPQWQLPPAARLLDTFALQIAPFGSKDGVRLTGHLYRVALHAPTGLVPYITCHNGNVQHNSNVISSSAQAQVMAGSGQTPALVVKTCPTQFQAWVRVAKNTSGARWPHIEDHYDRSTAFQFLKSRLRALSGLHEPHEQARDRFRDQREGCANRPVAKWRL